ncbi:MAG: hypothetical protein C5B48_06920 [Candidatus Rokuibacteriota bacterium]|nr:MAG: hypothetical protein C5B48_06920 [Candidatus Rokubacteria bacterium]
MMRSAALLVLLLIAPIGAFAAEWANVEPGVSSTADVRDSFGAPSKETSAKVDGYDTIQWIYEDERAPTGIVRMTVDFGLLTPSGYKPTTVRLLKLEPKPFIFGRMTLIQGWGIPDGVGKQDEFSTFFYKDGLFVVLDKEGETATSMIFSLPQPDLHLRNAPAESKP